MEDSIYYKKGLELASNGRFAEAVDVFRAAIHAQPLHINAYVQLAKVLERLKRYDHLLIRANFSCTALMKHSASTRLRQN